MDVLILLESDLHRGRRHLPHVCRLLRGPRVSRVVERAEDLPHAAPREAPVDQLHLFGERESVKRP